MGGVMIICKEITRQAPETVKALVAECLRGDALGVWIVGENSRPDNPSPTLGLMRDGDMLGSISINKFNGEDVLWLYT